MNVRNLFCWSDSQILLWWIRQVRKGWKVLIENRVQVIRKNAPPGYWMYVPTDVNPADITTRLLSPNTFVSCELWWNGPEFLQFEDIDIPCQRFLRPGELSEEQKAETVLFAGNEKAFNIGKKMDNSQFRSFQKLLRITCYVRRFVENLKIILRKVGKLCSGEISAEEMDSSIKF